MIIVGYIYNNNGMATWCIETATALHSLGEKVVLVKSRNIKLPADFPATWIDFDVTNRRSVAKKVVDKFNKYYQLLPFVRMEDDGFLEEMHQHLQSHSIHPQYYLLNQTSYASKKVQVPQYVVGWAYGPFFKDYLKKAFRLSASLKTFLYQLHFHLYWHKTDWIGYRKATGVLAVSEKLQSALVKKNIPAYTLYPCINSGTFDSKVAKGRESIRLAVMALDLEDNRKGLKRIINALKKLYPWRFTLVLIGGCSDSFKSWVLKGGFPATFTGLMKREQAIKILNDCDALLFGSLVDDWGYVQVEAMARGMVVLSPDASPFDEIVGRPDYLYDLRNENNLKEKLRIIIHSDNLLADKIWFHERYLRLFSSHKTGEHLMNILNSKVKYPLPVQNKNPVGLKGLPQQV